MRTDNNTLCLAIGFIFVHLLCYVTCAGCASQLKKNYNARCHSNLVHLADDSAIPQADKADSLFDSN